MADDLGEVQISDEQRKAVDEYTAKRYQEKASNTYYPRRDVELISRVLRGRRANESNAIAAAVDGGRAVGAKVFQQQKVSTYIKNNFVLAADATGNEVLCRFKAVGDASKGPGRSTRQLLAVVAMEDLALRIAEAHDASHKGGEATFSTVRSGGHAGGCRGCLSADAAPTHTPTHDQFCCASARSLRVRPPPPAPECR